VVTVFNFTLGVRGQRAVGFVVGRHTGLKGYALHPKHFVVQPVS